jgi:MYXO-CTERM domain-containing protein
MNFDDPAGSGGVSVQTGCDGFDCGAHGACVPMNGNPTCQCEGGYAAVFTTTYASDTGITTNQMTCQPVPGPLPPLPRLPEVGSTKMPAGSDSAFAGSGCNVASRPGNGTMAGLLGIAGLALTGLRRRRR